jgi:hypothetical protein
MNLKKLLPVLLVPAAILLIPLFAMLFKVEGWAWGFESFVAAWVLMAGVGLAYQLVTQKAVGRSYRVATGIALSAGFLLLWINGAVGIIGSEDNPANLLFAGALATGVIGAVIARFKPAGMAWALVATALAQFLVPVIALLIWRPDFSPGVVKIFVLNFVFVLLFAGSALLFRQAAHTANADRGEAVT